MSKQKCDDCPTKLSITKVIAICFFVSSSTFGLAKIYFKIGNNEKAIINLNKNTKAIADHLKKTGQVPYNLAFVDNSETYSITDAKIPKRRKNTRRIANDETATNKKEDFETLITE